MIVVFSNHPQKDNFLFEGAHPTCDAQPGSGFGQESGTFHFRTTFLPPVHKRKPILLPLHQTPSVSERKRQLYS